MAAVIALVCFLAWKYGSFWFMFAMLGLVLAGNLITLFIFWEITSVVSFLLVAY